MVCQPSPGFQVVVATEVVCDKKNVTSVIVGFNLFEQLDGVRRVARGSTSGQFFAIAHAKIP